MKQYIRRFLYCLFRILPVKRNQILFFSYYGENYGGSPKYLSEYFATHTNQFDLVWAFTDLKRHADMKEMRMVKYASWRYYYTLATSGVIITNYRMTSEFHKRKAQIYVQTWHSSLRLKMIEKDAIHSLPESYVRMARKDSCQIDVLLVGSRKGKSIFERAFWYDGMYLECGTPQCDLFFHETHSREKVHNFFHIAGHTQLVMYAPTFRKDHNLDVYNMDYERLVSALKQKFGGEWTVLLRLHPHLLHKADELQHNEGVVDATRYDDMQELLDASDVVITDYSALMFDYMLTGKPCFLYASDYESYVSHDRHLYFDIGELPFPIAFNHDELTHNIMNFDPDEYRQKEKQFLHESVGSVENGTACDQVMKYLEHTICDK